MTDLKSVRLAIHSSPDVITARQQAREMSEKCGCLGTTLAMITAVVSEVARRVAEHPLPGEMLLSIARKEHSLTVTMVVRVHYADRTAGLDISLDNVPKGWEVTNESDHTVVTLVTALESNGSRSTLHC
jgi:hypothetical protein